jgi:hypothetical protein
MAELVSVTQERGEDTVITKEALVLNGKCQCHHSLTLPQTNPSRKYSHTNPPYLEEAAALFIRKAASSIY